MVKTISMLAVVWSEDAGVTFKSRRLSGMSKGTHCRCGIWCNTCIQALSLSTDNCAWLCGPSREGRWVPARLFYLEFFLLLPQVEAWPVTSLCSAFQPQRPRHFCPHSLDALLLGL